jgi:TIR domain
MGTVFISHVEEDGRIALQLAAGLERKGYPTWCYELDSIPGLSHMDQTLKAIEECDIFILIISRACIRSHEVTTELTRAQDCGKKPMPLLSAISHEEFSAKRPEWVQRLGTVTCAKIPSNPSSLIPRLEKAFDIYNVKPTIAHDETKAERIATIEILLTESAPHIEKPEEPAEPSYMERLKNLQRKDAAKAELSFSTGARHIDELSRFLEGVFEREDLETQAIPQDSNVVIQARKKPVAKWKQALKSGLGLDLAVTVLLKPTGEALQVTIMPSKWADKAAGAAIGLLYFWPAAVTTGWGLVSVQQLIDRVEKRIQVFFTEKGEL